MKCTFIENINGVDYLHEINSPGNVRSDITIKIYIPTNGSKMIMAEEIKGKLGKNLLPTIRTRDDIFLNGSCTHTFFKVDEMEFKFEIEGLIDAMSQKFIGPVSVRQYASNDSKYPQYETAATLNLFGPISANNLTLSSTCTQKKFDETSGQLIQTEKGIRDENDQFIVSLVEDHVNQSIQFYWKKAENDADLSVLMASIKKFKVYFYLDIQAALDSPFLVGGQKTNFNEIKKLQAKSGSRPLSQGNLIKFLEEEGISLEYSQQGRFLISEQGGNYCDGNKSHRIFFWPTTQSEHARVLVETVTNFNDTNKTNITETHQIIHKKNVADSYLQRTSYVLKTDEKSPASYVSVRQSIEGDHFTRYFQSTIFSDGTYENTQGYISHETNDIPLFLQSPAQNLYSSIQKIKVTYLNRGARIICLSGNHGFAEQIKMLHNFDDVELMRIHDITTPNSVLYRFTKNEDNTHNAIILSGLVSPYRYRLSSLYHENQRLFKYTSHGRTTSDFKSEPLDEKFFLASKNDSWKEIPFTNPAESNNDSGEKGGALICIDRSDDHCADDARSKSSTPSAVDLSTTSSSSSETLESPIAKMDEFDEFIEQTLRFETIDVNPDAQKQAPPVYHFDEEYFDLRPPEFTDKLIGQLYNYRFMTESGLNGSELSEQEMPPIHRTLLNIIPGAFFARNKKAMQTRTMLINILDNGQASALQNVYAQFAVIDIPKYMPMLSVDLSDQHKMNAYQQPLFLIKKLREAVKVSSNNNGITINLNFSHLLLMIRIISWVDIHLTTRKGMLTSYLKAMNIFKSNDFMLYLLDIFKKGNGVICSNAQLNPNPKTIEESIVLVIRHLISIPDTPIYFFEYLRILNDNLCHFPRNIIALDENCTYMNENHAYYHLIRRNPLCQPMLNAGFDVDIYNTSPERLLILSLVLGQISHDSMPAQQIAKKYGSQNPFSEIIKFRNGFFHGNALANELSVLIQLNHHVVSSLRKMQSFINEYSEPPAYSNHYPMN